MVFMGTLFLCLVGCCSMIILTPAVLSVIYACVLYLHLFSVHMEMRSRNTFIIIIIIIININIIIIIIK